MAVSKIGSHLKNGFRASFYDLAQPGWDIFILLRQETSLGRLIWMG